VTRCRGCDSGWPICSRGLCKGVARHHVAPDDNWDGCSAAEPGAWLVEWRMSTGEIDSVRYENREEALKAFALVASRWKRITFDEGPAPA
jgi:hypothetical protein